MDFSELRDSLAKPVIAHLNPTPISLSYSDTQFEILQEYIQNFEKTLAPEYEIALLLTNFGQSISMIVTEISYEESVLIVFKGYVKGKMSTLIQHVSQLNFLITSVEKEPNRPKHIIGFTASDYHDE